jgi:lipase chaperone LimK
MISYPMDRNLLLLRVENIADLFDYPANATLDDTVAYVDLNQLARNLYQQANGNQAQLQAINIKEM